MKVLFVHHGRSFLPELPAYRECLEEAGHGTDVSMEPMSAALCSRYDLIFRFGGVLREIPGSTTPEVHEYHSASTTRLPRLKNFIKSVVAKRPAGRVFLSPFVRRQYFFNDNAPEIYRDMGASRVFIDCWNPDSRKQYDLTYCGSIAGRPTVVAALCRLGRLGLRVSIAGRATAAQAQMLLEAPNLFFAGELEASQVPTFLADARAGLNLCPNRYPFREQTSTKVIEYLAAGIPVVSNKYPWIEHHSKALGYQYLDIERVDSLEDLDNFHAGGLPAAKREELTWPVILERAGFVTFLESAATTTCSPTSGAV